MFLLHATLMLFAVWVLGAAMVQVASTYERAFLWMRIASLGWGTVYTVFLHWVLLVSANPWLKRQWHLVFLYFPAGVNVLVFSLLPGVSAMMYRFAKTPLGWVASPAPTFWNYFYSVYVAVYVLSGVSNLFWWGKRAESVHEKRQAYTIATAVLVAFVIGWTMDRAIKALVQTTYPPVTPVLLLFPFVVVFVTMVRYRTLLSLPMRPDDAQRVAILDRAEKIRLYSFLSLIYTLDGVTYVLYTHFVLRQPLEAVLPWGTLFVFLGMGIHYLGTLEVGEPIRDFLYVMLVSVIALVLAPRVHFLGEILYASFFFTAMIVAVLLGSLWVFVLQGALMGGILLLLWQPMAPLRPESGFTGLHALLVAFALFFALTFYVHRVYLRRLREHQSQLERQKAMGEISAQLVDVSHANFEQGFTRVLQTVDRYCGSHCDSFFLFAPAGKEFTGVSKWCYGSGCPDKPVEFPEDFFRWLGEKGRNNGGFYIDWAEAPLERELLARMNVQTAFLYPIKRGGKVLGFLGCGVKDGKLPESSFPELAEALSYRVADVLARVAQERDLYRTAFYDALTGLPNRALFRVHLEKAIQLARRTGKMVAILFVDLDAFKTINDAEGHEMGDRLLRRVANRLSGCVREHDTVARFGGDEFLVLLAQLNRHEEILPIVERILTSFRQPFAVHNQEFFITASIGIALYPGDGETPHDLIRNADLAMYVAKSQRGNGYAFCSPEMKESALTKKRLISGLYRALERQELRIYYQPQVNARTGDIVGLEALLRWHHPEMGVVLPGVFIPVAEQTGIIVSIGEWVLRTACDQVARWQKLGIPPLRLAVNLSAVQVRDPELPEKVKRVLTETGFNPQYLELEITETTFFQDPEHVSATLRALKNLGVNVTLDDFGTGYSFLTRLKALAVDRIKIDRHFLQGLLENSRDREIVKGIVRLAQSLEAQVTAEGVETEAQLEFLLEQGCEEIQGYYYYRPLPPEEIEGLLLSRLRLKG